MYATVINGQVVGCSYTIPHTYAGIDGFERLPPDEQRALGVFPLEEVKPALAATPIDDGDKDEDGNTIYRQVPTQAYGQATDEILADKVVRTYSVIPQPQADIRDETNRVALKKIASIEAKQDRAVREAALGDTTYLTQIEAQIAALRATLV